MTYLRFIYVVLVSNYLFKGILNIYYNFFIRLFVYSSLFLYSIVTLFLCSSVHLFLCSFILLFLYSLFTHRLITHTFFLLGLGRLGCFVVVICSRQKLYVHKGPFIIYGGGAAGENIGHRVM